MYNCFTAILKSGSDVLYARVLINATTLEEKLSYTYIEHFSQQFHVLLDWESEVRFANFRQTMSGEFLHEAWSENSVGSSSARMQRYDLLRLYLVLLGCYQHSWSNLSLRERAGFTDRGATTFLGRKKRGRGLIFGEKKGESIFF